MGPGQPAIILIEPKDHNPMGQFGIRVGFDARKSGSIVPAVGADWAAQCGLCHLSG